MGATKIGVIKKPPGEPGGFLDQARRKAYFAPSFSISFATMLAGTSS